MKVIGTAEATAVIADYFDLICDTGYAFDESEILRRMNANAVDAEPVRHGKWIQVPHKRARICSECECDEPYKFADEDADVFAFCPHCGASMEISND